MVICNDKDCSIIASFNYENKKKGNPRKENLYSPNDVLNNPKKYKNEIERINKADLTKPIIIHNIKDKEYFVVDGIHRLVKSKLLNKKNINVYIFNNNLMKKFLLDNNYDFSKIDKIEIYQYIELFINRFL